VIRAHWSATIENLGSDASRTWSGASLVNRPSMVISAKCGPPHDMPPSWTGVKYQYAACFTLWLPFGTSELTRSFNCSAVIHQGMYQSHVGQFLIIEANRSRNSSIKHTKRYSSSYELVHTSRTERAHVGNGNPRRHETRGITDPSAQPSEPKTHSLRVPRGRDRYPMPSVLEY
jgi:hypothetical protein